MKCFIINFNRLGLVREMVKHIPCEVIIIDNKSTYQPLLDWYKESGISVLHMPQNYGYQVFWMQRLYERLGGERYILTDPDLDLSGVPKDFIEVLSEGIDRYQFDKCGLSLKIDDLPDTEIGRKIKDWESKYWKFPVDSRYFNADIDTTFAMYRVNYHSYNALRTNTPYTALHVPWYYTDKNLLPEDERYYFNSLETPTHWSSQL